jgi:cellulose synthase (UDP-forming)
MMPLLFLLFHWHPIFSEVSVLLGHLVPYMILLPLISAALVPGWPRLFWGSAYENAVSLPLFRAMFDLLLPKNLGFKVTPKGIQSGRRTFDWRSSRWNLVAAGITVAAIGKGLFEFHFFGIEKDAYFFNLGWATYNLFLLGTALLVAWERPQRREEDRVAVRLPLRIRTGDGAVWDGWTRDVGLGGVGFESADPLDLGGDLEVELGLPDGERIRLPAKALYQERMGGTCRSGLAFASLDAASRRRILLGVFAHPGTWESAHHGHTRSHWAGAWYFLRGIALAAFPDRRRRRLHPRRRAWKPITLRMDGREAMALLQDRSSRACAVWIWSAAEPAASDWRVPEAFGGDRHLRLLHMRRPAPWLRLWRVTLAPRPETGSEAEPESAAMRSKAVEAA